MKDKDKAKAQLIDELEDMRQRVAVLEKSEVTHKQAEKILPLPEVDYQKLFELLPIGVTILDMKGVILYCNPAVYSSGGFTEGDLVGKHFSRIAPLQARDITNFVRIFASLTRGKVPKPFEVMYTRKDGTTGWTKLYISLLRLGRKRTSIQVIQHDITEHKQAEELYRSLVELGGRAGEAVVMLRDDKRGVGMHYFASDEWVSMTGYTKKELYNISMSDLIHPRFRDEATRRHKRRLLGEVLPGLYEISIIRKDGIEIPVEVTYAFSTYQGQRVAVGFIRDITERKQAEEEITKFKTIADIASYGVAIGSIEKLYYVNRAFAEMHGYSHDELIGKNYSILYTEEQLPVISRVRAQLLKTGGFVNEEVWHKKKDGTVFPTLMAGSLIRDKEGNPSIIAGTVIDITERKRAEQRIIDSEQKYINAEQMGSFGHFSRYLDTNRLVWSAGSYRIFGVDPNQWELTRENVNKMIHPQDREKLRRANEEVERGAKGLDTELRIIRLSGEERVVYFVADITFDDAGKPERLFGTMHDITEYKRAQEQLIKSQSELRSLSSHLQAAREEERTAIAGEIHDELGQALTAIKIDVSWIRDRLYNKQKHLFEKSNAMSGLIDETLSKVQRISAELRPSILDDLGLNAAVEWLVEEFQKRTEIECQLGVPDDPVELGQERNTAIFRILQESLINISRHAEATRVRITLRVKHDMLELKVIDNGKGIEITQIDSPKSFGLISMKERAHVLGGEISISGIQGKGTTISVHIPLN